MSIKTTKQFDKAFAVLPPKIKESARDRMKLFLKERKNPLLRDHRLTGNLEGKRAFSVT